jgi:putative transposase
MSEYRRANLKGGTYFFTVNTHNRQKILIGDDARNALREGIENARIAFPFHIVAWVLLPDHLHCIWTLPEGDAAFSKRWGMIKRHVSQHYVPRVNGDMQNSESRNKRNETGFWQRRYWEHQIRNEADLTRHIDYIHWNPMKHGLVDKVSDWPYSTFHRYVAKGLYPMNWCGDSRNEYNNIAFGE